jgi:recombination protein RecR
LKNTLNTIAALVNQFTKLPGVGQKTAQRYAYKIIDMSKEDALAFIDAIKTAKEKVEYCRICGSFFEVGTCSNCSQPHKSLCVVAWPKDCLSAARIKGLKCSFHVLHGTISPLDNRTPDDIKLKELVSRIGTSEVEEVVLALNPDVEGETTSLYIARLLKPLGIKTTRLAQGISMGTDLEYADDITLTEAYNNRKEL